MRTLKFFALVSIFLATTVKPYSLAARNHQEGIQETNNYVVIGAFAVQRNAVKFTTYAKRQSYDAKYEINPARSLYYVYVLNTDDHELALNEAKRLRVESPFVDAWVYGGTLGETPAASGQDIDPHTETSFDITSGNQSASSDRQTDDVSVNAPALRSEGSDAELTGKKFVFDLYRATDNAKVEGDVDVIDPERNKKLASYKGNQSVRISEPSSPSGDIILLCEVFGYRKLQRGINYNDPQGEGVRRDESDNVVVPFDLVRLKKGDVAIMYNVYFFKDAAVMRPESQYEVNSLLEMLQENPKYEIKIHGHTNGSAPGKIISATGDENYFSLTGTKEGYGSAKELSERRAKVIRDFLVSNGIEEKRMEIKAWGGKRPLHDKHSTRAQENVRVEIEILED